MNEKIRQMSPEEKLLEAIFYGPQKMKENDKENYFKLLVNCILTNDIKSAHCVYEEALKADNERCLDDYFKETDNFTAYVNDKKKTTCLVFKDGVTSKCKCDEKDEFNPLAGIAIAYMKAMTGCTSNTEFKSYIDSKLVHSEKAEKKTSVAEKDSEVALEKETK